MKNALQSISTRPYLIRALFEWCNGNSLTPYIAVKVDSTVQVPKEYVKNGEIVLNISLDATSGLQITNEYIEFKARFGGTPRVIVVPVGQVIAIYAKENGQGMAFPAPSGNPKESPNLSEVPGIKFDRNSDKLKTESAQPPLTLLSIDTEHSSRKEDDLDPEQSRSVAPTQEDSDGPGDPIDLPPSPASGARPKLTLIK